MLTDKRVKARFTFALCLLPAIAYANAGSPMMWLGMFHLLVLNSCIGYAESVILVRFKIPNRTGLIILGNYVSMLIGFYFIAPNFSTAFGNSDFWGMDTSYGNYPLIGFVAGMITSFFATLIIEYPFFIKALQDKNRRENLFYAFFISNTITNVVMFSIYLLLVAGGGFW